MPTLTEQDDRAPAAVPKPDRRARKQRRAKGKRGAEYTAGWTGDEGGSAVAPPPPPRRAQAGRSRPGEAPARDPWTRIPATPPPSPLGAPAPGARPKKARKANAAGPPTAGPAKSKPTKPPTSRKTKKGDASPRPVAPAAATTPPGAPTKAGKAALTPREIVRRQRRRRRRTLIGSIIFLIVANLIVGSAATYVRWRLGQINRIDLPGLTPELAADGVMNVLVVGSDSRARLSGEAAAQAGKDQVSGERSDTIMILHVDPARQKAAILSIPRDTYVPIARTSGSDRINSAFAVGGAAGLISTIKDALGIHIHHYVEVDFVGFKDIVNAVGGVRVYLSAPAKDDFSLLEIYDTGCITLDGEQGLAWVRSRHFESFIGGQWQADPRADLGRIERQQDFTRRMLRKAVSSGLSNPLTLNRLIGIGVDNVTIDAAMSTSDITRIARRFSNLDPEKVEMLTLPTTLAEIDGKSVLRLNEPEVRTVVDKINGRAVDEPAPADPGTAPTTPGIRPTDIKVDILNGNGVPGAAGKGATDLTGAGFVVGERGDADSASYARTVVRYGTGQQAKAQVVQSYLTAGADLKEDATVRTTDAVVVVGSDYAGVRAPAGPLPTAVTTTAPAATTPTTVAKETC